MFEVSWSGNPSFSPLLGEMIVDDATQLECNITGLTSVSFYRHIVLVVVVFLHAHFHELKHLQIPSNLQIKCSNHILSP